MIISELVEEAYKKQTGKKNFLPINDNLRIVAIDIVIDIAEKYDLKAWIMDEAEVRRQRWFMGGDAEMLWVETRAGLKDDYCIAFEKDLSSHVRGKLRKLKIASL